MRVWQRTVVIAGVLGLAGCAETEAPAEIKPRPVQTIVIPEAGAALTRSFSGKATASRQKHLSFKVGGTLMERPMRVGDRVVKGDLLARLDDSSYLLQRDQARAQLRQAEAQSRQSHASYQRTKGLYREDVVSKSALDQARAGAESASAQVQARKNELALADLNVSYARLSSKENCAVAVTNVEVGENISVGEAVATLECGENVDVLMDIPGSLINAVKAGANVKVRFNAIANRSFTGHVTEVGVASGGSGTFPVKIRLVEHSDAVRPGLAASVDIEFPYKEGGGLVIPLAALSRGKSGEFVYIVDVSSARQGVIARRNVTIGKLTNEGIEVLSGLRAGELLVTAGVNTIYDGLTVRLTVNREY